MNNCLRCLMTTVLCCLICLPECFAGDYTHRQYMQDIRNSLMKMSLILDGIESKRTANDFIPQINQIKSELARIHQQGGFIDPNWMNDPEERKARDETLEEHLAIVVQYKCSIARLVLEGIMTKELCEALEEK